ncbi:MAG: hypothetical protein JOZ14_20035 [Acidobacteria bacterium]|nr:hypothetical protein [Acidobacteriota bacterium]
MKVASGSQVKFAAVLVAMIFVAANSWAASKGTLEINQPTQVAGTQLARGKYTVRWEGTGDQVELKIYNGGRVVTSTPAHKVKVQSRTSADTAVVSHNGDGSLSLTEIRFGGKDFALQIGEGGGGAGASGAAK